MVILGVGQQALATAPTLYHQSAYQSPVRGAADDLLLLAGNSLSASDVAVYRRIEGIGPLSPPIHLPVTSDVAAGAATIVSAADVPHSLAVRLPRALQSDRPYAIWVCNSAWECSNAVTINDARPFWVSPAYVYESPVEGIPRVLKVVGRNLQATAGNVRIRLTGPRTLTLKAIEDPAARSLNRYVAKAALPDSMTPGDYRVDISNDDVTWIRMSDQVFHVRVSPSVSRELFPSDSIFGGCRSDDAQDDALCVRKALQAAKPGETVVLGRGSWNLGGKNNFDGIVVPDGVNLRGEGPDITVLNIESATTDAASSAVLILQGHNSIRGITFRETPSVARRSAERAALQLGETVTESMRPDDKMVAIEDVVITGNAFERIGRAIVDGGRPIKNIFVTHNVFGAYAEDIHLAGNRFLVQFPFRIDDSVIAFNRFSPGSYLDAASKQGSIATELGAGLRVDFSSNTADGADARFLDSAQDAKGWRAAFFWHMNNNNEQVLVSENLATCTGDKIGDGEAIVLDNNGNTFAFDEAKKVRDATHDSVTVDDFPLRSQNNRRVPLDTFYVGHYVQVGDGPGIGQTRKIKSYRIDRDSGRTTFTVAPDWDVPPAINFSRISVGREFWQIYIVANVVDHRTPLCGKTNRSARKGGSIGIAGQTSDSVVEGNRQFDTDGIIFAEQFSARDSQCSDCDRGTNYLSFSDIRDNEIVGEYDWTDGCSSSGIFGSVAVSPAPSAPPTTVGYGNSIAHNRIIRADAWRGGAIALTPTWYVGPAPHRWPLVVGTLIHHNTIDLADAAPAKPCQRDVIKPRIGINLAGSELVQRTVLYANECHNVALPMALGAQAAVRICDDAGSFACECKRANRRRE